MAWANSKIFSAFVTDQMNQTASNVMALSTATVKVALYHNANTTPVQDVANTLTGYNQTSSAWVVANEVSGTSWTAGGLTLGGQSSSFTTNVYKFTGSNVSNGAADTLQNAGGVLVYNGTLTNKNGICYNYFGGAASVTSGTLTVVWNASGIFTLTL